MQLIRLRHINMVLMSLLVSASVPFSAYAGSNPTARIAVHLVPVPQGKTPYNVCEDLVVPPCNDGESSLTVNGDTGVVYFAYFLVMDGTASDPGGVIGVGGAAFGISFGPNVTVQSGSWVHCADFEVPSGSPAWPTESGSGVILTWLLPQNCQSTPASGDSTGGITAILGALKVSSSADDYLSVVKRPATNPDLTVADCGGRTTSIRLPQGAGSVSFGSLGSGFDPCKGPFSPFTDFQSLSSNELDSMILKLTALGVQATTVIIKGTQAVEDPLLFSSYERLGYDYSNDMGELPEFPFKRFQVAASEMQALIDSVSIAPSVTDGGVDLEPELSFSMFNTSGSEPKVFESLVGDTNGTALLQALRGAASPSVDNAVDGMACALQMLPASGPADVTTSTDISVGGFRLDHSNDRFVGIVTITNSSGAALGAPLRLVLNEGPNIVLEDPSGYTCGPYGPTYIDLPVGSGLAPSQTVEIEIHIKDTTPPKFDFTPEVYSGGGVL